MKLEHSKSDWSAFAGACAFPDRSGPFFAELPYVRWSTFDGSRHYGQAVLVLDSAEGTDYPTLTVNLADLDESSGYVAVATLGFPIGSARDVAAWAEKRIETSASLSDLEAIGFRFAEA